MMERLLSRISANDLHWLNSMDPAELRTLLQLLQTAKQKKITLDTLIDAHNTTCAVRDP